MFFLRCISAAKLASIAVVALSGVAAYAQTTGTILGQVLDSTKAAISNAGVEAENVNTGLTRKALTNAEGTYLIPSLPPGSYRITVSVPGFKIFTQSGILLEVGQNARVDAVLQVGTVSEEVTVAAQALSVDTQSTTVGATVDNRRLTTIPLNGRNVLSLAQLLPGVGTGNIQTTVPNARSGPTITISGARDTDNNIILDGASMVELMYNRGINLPSPDALQEFRVLTNTYSAEYGRAGGGVFLAVSKSGTNELHGSLFEFLRNDDLNARNFFAAGKPFLRQNQFGGSVGGPVILPKYDGRNRTFIFGSFQGIRIRQQQLFTSFPATARERQGVFSNVTKPIIDPLSGVPFPGNVIPTGRIDPVATNFMNAYEPLPNQPDGRLLTLRRTPTTGDQYDIKDDHLFSASDRLNLRYFQNYERQENQSGGDSEALAGPQFTYTKTGSIGETHIFNPGMLNEFRMSYLRLEPTWLPSPLNKTPKELGGNWNPDGPFPLAPNLSVSGRFSGSPLIFFTEPESTFEYTEKLSWIHGRHSIKAGGEFRRLRHVTRAQFPSASMTFDGTFTGNAMADFVLGRPTNLFQQSYLEDVSRAGQYQPFIQDDFKISRRLTLNIGLRYELNTPWVQLFDHTATIRPYVGCSGDCEHSQKFPTAPPGLVYPGDRGVPRGLYPTPKHNFAPRFGFAWDPTGNGRTSIRGAWGLFYTYSGAIISSTVNQTPPYILPLSFPTPFSLSDPYRGRVNPFPYKVDLKNPIYVYPTQQYSVSPDYQDGRVQQFNLNVQHQFGQDLIVQLGYVGRLSRHLTLVREANAAIWTPTATASDIQQRRPFFPQFYGPVSLISSDINAEYNSMQLSLDKKFSHGYTLQLAYTFSKSLDERSANPVDGGDTPQDPNNFRAGERGLSAFNQKHILAVNGVWELPFMKTNKGFLPSVLGGWQLAGTTRVGSGLPFSVYSGKDNIFVGTGRSAGLQRPDVVGNPVLDPGRPRGQLVAEYFDPAAFIPNGGPGRAGQYGNSGRNNLVGPGFSQTDLAVLKHFSLPKERLGHFEFRTEIFNLLNQVNFNNPGVGGPSSTLVSPAFGRLLSARDSRVVQFGLRYDF
jgi:hypothetical protein